jgi:hypothetical protein
MLWLRPGPPDGRRPTATITVARPAGLRDGLRAYRVVVDGRAVARLRRGQLRTIAVSPGRHRLYVRLDWWLRCPEVEVVLAPADRADFLCRPRGGVLEAGFLVESDPGNYLELTRAAAPGANRAAQGSPAHRLQGR